MLLPLLRSAFLFLCTMCAYAVFGYTPGAINLRTRDLETELAADGKSTRDLKNAYALPDETGGD